MTVSFPPQKRRTNIVGGDQLQAGAVTYDKIESDLLERIESTTLKAKENYVAFNTADSGEIYLHGLVDGQDADVDGYIIYGGVKYIVSKGPVVTQLNQEGYLVYSTADDFATRGYTLSPGQTILAAYVSDGVWYYDDGDGTSAPFTPQPSTDLAIGYFRTDAVDSIEDATIFKDPVPINEIVVTARRILANSILSQHITAGEILTVHMDANSINADRLLTNTLDASKITSSTLLADLILSGSIKTSDTGARVEITNAGIQAFDSLDANTIDVSSSDGSVTITGGLVAGGAVSGASITGGTIDIGGADNTSFHVDSNGYLWVGDAAYADAPFKVSNTGALTSSDVTITGSSGNIINTTNFVVTGAGAVTADDATFNSGNINGNFTVNGILDVNGGSIQLTSGDLNLSGTGNINVSQGDVIVSASGEMRSSNYVANTSGWILGPNGLEINDGAIATELITIADFGISNVNLLKNASFENGANVATDWASHLSGATATFTTSTAEFLFQSKSQRINITGSGASAGVFQDIVFNEPLNAEEDFTVSYWIKQTAGTAKTARLGFFPYNSTTGAYKNTTTKTLTIGPWTRVVDTFTPTSIITDGIRIYLTIDNVVTGDLFYLEGAQAQRSRYVTDFQPAPLDIPESYIDSVHINSLGADKLTSGTISAQTLTIGATGFIQSVDWDGTGNGYRLDSAGATFQNGAVSIVGASGAVVLNSTEFKAMYGGQDTLLANSAGVKLAGTIAVNQYGIQSSNWNGTNTTTSFDTRFKASTTGWQITPGGDAGFTNVYIRQGLFLAHSKVGTGTTGDSIQSSNFVSGTSGWAIFGNGDAEFNNGIFRGNIAGGTIDIGDADTTSFHVNNAGAMWLGAGTWGAAPFRVNSAGAAYATNLQITGGSISIGSNFSVNTSGVLTAYGANISGNITANSLAAYTYISTPTIEGGSISGTSINIGNGTFTVDSSGVMNASSGTFSGRVDAKSGEFTGTVNIGTSGKFRLIGSLNRARIYANNTSNYLELGGTSHGGGTWPELSWFNSSGSYQAALYYAAGNGVTATAFTSNSFIRSIGQVSCEGSGVSSFSDGSHRGWSLGNAKIKGLATGSTIQVRNSADSAYGTLYAYMYDVSSEKFKTDIKPWEKNALSMITSTPVKQWRWKESEHPRRVDVGVVVEDLPVEFQSNDGDAYKIGSVVGVLWKAVQEMSQEIELLKQSRA